MNPYEILGLTPECGDAAVREAYLALVKRFPPERHPEKFRHIQEAYQALRDEKSRLSYYLYRRERKGNSPLQTIVLRLSDPESRRPLDFTLMKEYLRQCAMR